MKVAVDLEDVLVDTNSVFVEKLNSFVASEFPESGLSFQKSDINGWRFEGLREPLSDRMGWDRNIVDRFMHGHGSWKGYFPITEEIWREEHSDIPWIEEEARNRLEELREVVENKNGEVHLVTARQGVKEKIEEKLGEKNLGDTFDHIVVETQKHRMEYDFYIDDNPQLLPKLGSKKVQLVKKQPWNRHLNTSNPHRKVDDLSECIEVVQNLG